MRKTQKAETLRGKRGKSNDEARVSDGAAYEEEKDEEEEEEEEEEERGRRKRRERAEKQLAAVHM